MLEGFLNNLFSRVVTAAVILLAGAIIAKVSGRIVSWTVLALGLKDWAREAGLNVVIGDVLSTTAQYIVYIIAVLAALDALGLQKAVLLILAAIIALVLAVIVALNLFDIFFNIIASASHRSIPEGATVIVGRESGKVVAPSILSTKVILDSGEYLIVPRVSKWMKKAQ